MANKSIDGRVWKNDPVAPRDIFHSDGEPFPWLEIELETERMITGLFILNNYRNGDRLKELVVRVGNAKVPDGQRGTQLTTNDVVGNFAGPGEDGETYMIEFSTPVRGKFISLQLLFGEWFHIEEVYLPGGSL